MPLRPVGPQGIFFVPSGHPQCAPLTLLRVKHTCRARSLQAYNPPPDQARLLFRGYGTPAGSETAC